MPIPCRSGPAARSLARRWIAGDRAAGNELCRLYYTRVWRFGLSLTGREHDADDIAQHALAVGLDALRGGKRPERLTGWILGIARNAALAHWHYRTNRLAPAPDPCVLTDPAAEVDPELPEAIAGAMAVLDADERAMIRMRFVDRETCAQAAARAGLSVGGANRLLVRALTKLRRALSSWRAVIPLARVERLPPALRTVVEARHLRGLTLAQTAVALRLPVATCALRLRCAYRELGCTKHDDFSAARSAHLARAR